MVHSRAPGADLISSNNPTKQPRLFFLLLLPFGCFVKTIFTPKRTHTKTAKHEQEQANDNDRLPEKMMPNTRRVSPLIGTILIMQRPIHGTWPPTGTLRPMQVALNCRVWLG